MDDRIVRFRPAARKNNFRWFTTQQRRQPFASKIDGFSRFPGKAIPARRVAVIFGQERQHFLDHGGIELGRGVVIEVNDFIIRHRSPL